MNKFTLALPSFSIISFLTRKLLDKMGIKIMLNNKHEAITCSAMHALIMVVSDKERSASQLYPSENCGKSVTPGTKDNSVVL